MYVCIYIYVYYIYISDIIYIYIILNMYIYISDIIFSILIARIHTIYNICYVSDSIKHTLANIIINIVTTYLSRCTSYITLSHYIIG